MSEIQSNLGSAQYGYDVVVATTQNSVNATMQEYLYNTVFPTVRLYWNQDEAGNPVPVTYDELMKQTNGTDPLLVPSWSGSEPMSQDILNIQNSNFFYAFEAAIGIPATMPPCKIPPIVELQVAGNLVNFTLICSEFTIASCNFGRHGLQSFLNESQQDSDPWLFISSVPLQNITDNTNLPKDVQKQLDNFGPTAFSVQQLLFDLDNAKLESMPTISGVSSGTPLYNALEQVFLGAYFKEMKLVGQPILGCSILPNNPSNVPPSTFTLTNLEMEVSAYNPANDPSNSAGTAEAGLNTLNYLGAINKNTLPPSVQFTWNWIDTNDTADGVVAIQSNDFIAWMNSAFSPSLNQITLIPDCVCKQEKWVELEYNLSFTEDTSAQSFTTLNPRTTASDGSCQVLTFSYSQYSGQNGGSWESGVWGDLQCTYTASCIISFLNDTSGSVPVGTIEVSTNVNANMHVMVDGGVTAGNFASYTSVMTYTLSVDDEGALSATAGTPTVTDNSQNPDVSGWSKFVTLGQVDGMITKLRSDLQTTLNGFVTNFDDSITNVINSAQTFVFPGGVTFTFADVAFSDFQDLVSHITYVQPSAGSAMEMEAENSEALTEVDE